MAIGRPRWPSLAQDAAGTDRAHDDSQGMIDISHYPAILFLVAAPVLWLAARFGVWLGRRHPLDDEVRQDFNPLQGCLPDAARPDHRLQLLDGGGSLRSAQEPGGSRGQRDRHGIRPGRPAAGGRRAKLRPLLKSYLDLRIAYYDIFDKSETGAINKRTAKLQAELWAAILGPAAATPTPVMALVVAGMNDVLNSQGYTQAAWWNRIPGSAWGLMGVIALVCQRPGWLWLAKLFHGEAAAVHLPRLHRDRVRLHRRHRRAAPWHHSRRSPEPDSLASSLPPS